MTFLFFFSKTKGSTSILAKPKEPTDPLDQLLPPQLNDLVDTFV